MTLTRTEVCFADFLCDLLPHISSSPTFCFAVSFSSSTFAKLKQNYVRKENKNNSAYCTRQRQMLKVEKANGMRFKALIVIRKGDFVKTEQIFLMKFVTVRCIDTCQWSLNFVAVSAILFPRFFRVKNVSFLDIQEFPISQSKWFVHHIIYIRSNEAER